MFCELNKNTFNTQKKEKLIKCFISLQTGDFINQIKTKNLKNRFACKTTLKFGASLIVCENVCTIMSTLCIHCLLQTNYVYNSYNTSRMSLFYSFPIL